MDSQAYLNRKTEHEVYKKGYIDALHDFGIWKNGVQYIGCLETPIKEIIRRKFGDKDE